jgi:glycosyltransferase involved in cell wall biosynthesis
VSTVGLALIVKNEEKSLPRLLGSLDFAFDQVVLVDTGSKDKTIEVFKDWAALHPAVRTRVEKFKWCNDFAKARNFADSLLDTDWCVWADADDVIVNAANIRKIVESADPTLGGFICGYDYAQHPETGANVCFLKRERIVRKELKSNWIGRVHEAQQLHAPLQWVPPEVVVWKHQKIVATETFENTTQAVSQSNNRNLKILRQWNKDEPENPRVLSYLGMEYSIQNQHRRAISYYRQYIKLPTGWSAERAQVHRRLCASLMALERYEDAYKIAFGGMMADATWPDNYLTLAELAMHKGDYAQAIKWADDVLRMGVPDTVLIINPMEYTFVPARIKAEALGSLGRTDEAVKVGQEALQQFPELALMEKMQEWEKVNRRERTADTYTLCAQQLMNLDEQEKAVILLRDCVPHIAIDHPKVAQLRNALNVRLHWVYNPEEFKKHYTDGGSKPEDFVGDDRVDEVCFHLPRCHFLVDGIMEQLDA